MKISLGNRRLIAYLLLTLLVSYAGACEVDTRVSIVDDNNPPKFKLSGNGTLITLFVYGPFSTPEGFRSRPDEVKPVWQFGVGLPGSEIRDLSVITYGETPVGFHQLVPKQGPPPPIEEGKFYMVTPISGSANWEAFCFTFEGGKAKEISCH
jgi:hypothetical protein